MAAELISVSLTLNLSKQPTGVKVLRLGQGDSKGTTLTVLIMDNDSKFSLSGYKAYLEILLPGQKAYVRQQGTVGTNSVTFTIDETKLTAAGVTDVAYVSIEKDGEVIASTERFRVVILKSAKDAEPAQSWVSEIDRAAQNLAAAQKGVQAALKASQDALGAAQDAQGSYEAAAKASSDSQALYDSMESRFQTAEAARQDEFDAFMAERRSGDYVVASDLVSYATKRYVDDALAAYDGLDGFSTASIASIRALFD